jgi:hypothetical protein
MAQLSLFCFTPFGFSAKEEKKRGAARHLSLETAINYSFS